MNATSTELIVPERTEPSPLALMGHASDVAGACKAIVTQTARQIGPKRYVCVEGWQAIAIAHGCVASSGNVERIEGGVRAVGEVRRMDTGAVIASAEGFVGDDEPVWAGGGHNPKTGRPYDPRPEFARRAMAQTRAISRACRSAFAHIVCLLNAGLETTPAEEMEGALSEHGTNGHAPAPPAKAVPRNVTPPAKAAAPVGWDKEKQSRPPSQTGATITRGFVERTTAKESTTNGKAWTRYGVQIATDEGVAWYNTFSTEVGELAQQALKQNIEFAWKMGKPRKDGTPSRDLVEILGILFDPPADEADDAREPDAEG